MGSKDDLEYAIIGGGISGLTLAIAMHHRGLKIKIYEQAQHFGEIGAGVSLSPNAVQAMKICHDGVFQAFEKVCTRNIWESKQKVFFDYYDAINDGDDPKHSRPMFTITNSLGQNGVHRARFLDEVIKLIPNELASFGKRLDKITTGDDGRLTMTFVDGSTATADAILGCDGIKSRVRQLMFGVDHPSAFPTYTHKYAYRALVPMKDAIETIGEEKAQNACMHVGIGSHVLTFPINHGQIVNVVAFHTTEKEWPDPSKLTAATTRENALRDFDGYGQTVTSLLKLAKPELDTWAIFDLGDHPLETYVQGNIALVGDAAHATSPHHGGGAGMCIEDSAVLSELLADDRVRTRKDAALALQAYDVSRRERTQWLVQSSRFIGDTYEGIAEGVGPDPAKMEAEIDRRKRIINDVDVEGFCKDAKAELGKLLEKQ